MTSPAVRWGLIKYLAGLPLLPSHTFVTQTNTSQPWPSLASPDHISTNQRQPRTSHIFVRVKYGFQEEYYQRSLTFLYNRLFLKFKISRFAVLSLARMLWTAGWWCEVWGARLEGHKSLTRSNVIWRVSAQKQSRTRERNTNHHLPTRYTSHYTSPGFYPQGRNKRKCL